MKNKDVDVKAEMIAGLTSVLSNHHGNEGKGSMVKHSRLCIHADVRLTCQVFILTVMTHFC